MKPDVFGVKGAIGLPAAPGPPPARRCSLAEFWRRGEDRRSRLRVQAAPVLGVVLICLLCACATDSGSGSRREADGSGNGSRGGGGAQLEWGPVERVADAWAQGA